MSESASAELKYRAAGPDDAPAIATLHADSWRRHYRGAFADAFLDHRDHQFLAEPIMDIGIVLLHRGHNLQHVDAPRCCRKRTSGRRAAGPSAIRCSLSPVRDASPTQPWIRAPVGS